MCSAVSRLPFVRTGEGKSCLFTEEIFKNRLLLLKRHVDENESLQLEILYASQVAVTKLKHPPSKLGSKNKIHCYSCRYFNCLPSPFLSGATPDLHITLWRWGCLRVRVQSVERTRLRRVRKRRVSTSFQCVLWVAWNYGVRLWRWDLVLIEIVPNSLGNHFIS